MAEAIIRCKRYKKVAYTYKTEIVTANQNWTVPSAIDQLFTVRIFGGGGGCGGSAGNAGICIISYYAPDDY